MSVLEAINQVLDALCGEDLRRRLGALREVLEGTIAGEVLLKKILGLIREDQRARAFVLLQAEQEFLRLRSMVPEWEITMDGRLVQRFVTYAEGVREYRKLAGTVRGAVWSLHRVEAAVRREVG